MRGYPTAPEQEWHRQYTDEELEVIRAAWPGKPPAQCAGKCKLSHFFAAGCKGCGWHEEIPVDGLDEYND